MNNMNKPLNFTKSNPKDWDPYVDYANEGWKLLITEEEKKIKGNTIILSNLDENLHEGGKNIIIIKKDNIIYEEINKKIKNRENKDIYIYSYQYLKKIVNFLEEYILSNIIGHDEITEEIINKLKKTLEYELEITQYEKEYILEILKKYKNVMVKKIFISKIKYEETIKKIENNEKIFNHCNYVDVYETLNYHYDNNKNKINEIEMNKIKKIYQLLENSPVYQYLNEKEKIVKKNIESLEEINNDKFISVLLNSNIIQSYITYKILKENKELILSIKESINNEELKKKYEEIYEEYEKGIIKKNLNKFAEKFAEIEYEKYNCNALLVNGFNKIQEKINKSNEMKYIIDSMPKIFEASIEMQDIDIENIDEEQNYEINNEYVYNKLILKNEDIHIIKKKEQNEVKEMLKNIEEIDEKNMINILKYSKEELKKYISENQEKKYEIYKIIHEKINKKIGKNNLIKIKIKKSNRMIENMNTILNKIYEEIN